MLTTVAATVLAMCSMVVDNIHQRARSSGKLTQVSSALHPTYSLTYWAIEGYAEERLVLVLGTEQTKVSAALIELIGSGECIDHVGAKNTWTLAFVMPIESTIKLEK